VLNVSETNALETYIRQSQLLRDRIVPFSPATLWRKVKDGSFPAPVKLSAGVTAWKLRDIQDWQRAQVQPGSGSKK